MNYVHAFAMACAIVLLTQGLEGQTLSRYRTFELGSGVAAVTTQAGITPGDAKMLHRRPAVLQDLEWRPSRWTTGSITASTDPVKQILFSFYNDQLFRLVVDYASDRTEGMTAADMTEAIAAVYGTPLLRASRTAGTMSRIEVESGTPVAGWADNGHAVRLYQTSSYGSSFRLVLTETRLDDLARKAETEARRLDAQEAPSREVARQEKERDDSRDAAAKARETNKGVFRP